MAVRTYSEIYNDLKNTFLARQNKITDFNNASIINAFFEAVAIEEARKYEETKAGYNANLHAVPASLFDFKNKDGLKATGKVVFKREKPVNYTTHISKGTVVSAGNLKYETTETAIIENDSIVSQAVSIIARESGVKYNVVANQINQIETSVSSDVISVENTQNIRGGEDKESDNDMLNRFKNYINGLQGTSSYGLKTATESVEGVKSVNVVENFNTFGESPYHVVVYAADSSGSLAPTIKNEIENIINGDGTGVNPGKRAPGINVLVQAPGIVSVNVTVTCYYKMVDTDVVESNIIKVIKDYINSLGIGENVVATRFISLINDSVSGIEKTENVSLRNNESENDLNFYEDLIITSDQIAKFNTCTVNLLPYEE